MTADKTWPRSLDECIDKLIQPFARHELGAKPAKGNANKKLPYVHAPAVMNRLDSVVGPHNWSLDVDPFDPETGAVKVTLTVLGVARSNIGDSNNPKSMVGPQVFKESVTDGIKRAAMLFGIGRYLWPGGAEGIGVVNDEDERIIQDEIADRMRTERDESWTDDAQEPPRERAETAKNGGPSRNGTNGTAPASTERKIRDLSGVKFTEEQDSKGRAYYQTTDACPVHGGPFYATLTGENQLTEWSHAIKKDGRKTADKCYRARL